MNRTRALTLLGASAIAFTVPIVARNASTIAAPARAHFVEAQIERLEEERRHAVLAGDLKKLREFYADGMTLTDISGDFHLTTGEWQPPPRITHKWVTDEIRVEVLAPNAAVALIKAEIDDSIGGKHRDFTARLMDVWIERDGRWQIVARQGTRIATRPPILPIHAEVPAGAAYETEMRLAKPLTREGEAVFDSHRALHDAHRRADVSRLGQFLTKNWVVTNPAGQVRTREQLLETARPLNPPRLQDGIRIRTFGHVAVMTVRSIWPDGRMQRGTEVFVREKGGWRQAFNQQTEVST